MTNIQEPATYRTLQEVIDLVVAPALSISADGYDMAGIAARIVYYCRDHGGFHILPMYDSDHEKYSHAEWLTVLIDHDLAGIQR